MAEEKMMPEGLAERLAEDRPKSLPVQTVKMRLRPGVGGHVTENGWVRPGEVVELPVRALEAFKDKFEPEDAQTEAQKMGGAPSAREKNLEGELEEMKRQLAEERSRADKAEAAAAALAGGGASEGKEKTDKGSQRGR